MVVRKSDCEYIKCGIRQARSDAKMKALLLFVSDVWKISGGDFFSNQKLPVLC